MKERTLPCINYICDGKCKLNKECHFWKEMQKCQKYIANKNYKPARIDRRKEKKNKILKKEFQKGDW